MEYSTVVNRDELTDLKSIMLRRGKKKQAEKCYMDDNNDFIWQ